MDNQYLQNIRYNLQKRFSRVSSSKSQIYISALAQFWEFIHKYELFRGILDNLSASSPLDEKEANELLEKSDGSLPHTELEMAAMSYWAIKKIVSDGTDRLIYNIVYHYSHETDLDENVSFFTDLFVEPLYEFIDEQVDNRGAILALLQKFKQKSEWFNRQQLYQAWESDTIRGEYILTQNLYEFLHDQGIEFYIEPSSASGEIDLISSQEGAERLLADAKIFNPDHSHDKGYLARGFKQLYTYTLDFNEPVGYLIIFNTSGQDLQFAVNGYDQLFPSVTFNHKTIFLILIDIYPHKKTASKRGRIKPHTITEEDLTGLKKG